MQKKWSHLTFDYVADRVAEIRYQRINPEMPWLTPQGCEILTDLVVPGDHVLEFGSGRSTQWFAKRSKKVTSIEHNPDWFESVTKDLEKLAVPNVELLLIEDKGEYVSKIDKMVPNQSIDIILIDGIRRDACAMIALNKIRPGGVIIIDDSHRYFPSDSRVPRALVAGKDNCAVDTCWPEFDEKSRDFRRIRTSSGVSDTTFLFAV